MYKAVVYVTLKNGVLDPQGATVQSSLHSLDYKEVTDVKVGKYMEVTLKAASEAEANQRVTEMCEKLLANPVIEDYTYTLSKLEGIEA